MPNGQSSNRIALGRQQIRARQVEACACSWRRCRAVDGSIVKVHCAGQGALGGSNAPNTGSQNHDIGRSRGGVTTKILALKDALGNLADFRLLPRSAHDLRGVLELLDGLEAGRMLAD
jgi:hypothetical protein